MNKLANRKPDPSRATDPATHDGRQDVAKTSHGAVHKQRPAGTKLVLRFFKAKHGARAKSVEEAWNWYRTHLADADKKVRQLEEARKIARIKRNHPWLADRLPAAA